MEEKSLKQYAKEAKRRLKSGFWQNYRAEIEERKKKAVLEGIAISKVVEYCKQDCHNKIKTDVYALDDEDFYNRVKELLDTYGEVDDIIGRLVDESVFNDMPYDKRQKYMFDLSNRYLIALERYRKENALISIL
ncbi:MAG: hypothetical protein J6B16_01785 [Clostridia bacterium]|nr:hypothetical protein [Clostridia bacterium]